MSWHYIQTDENGLVTGESWLAGEVEAEGLILVDDDFDPAGKKYEDGEWVPYEPEPDPFPDLIDENEQAQLEMQANVQYLTDLAEINMEG